MGCAGADEDATPAASAEPAISIQDDAVVAETPAELPFATEDVLAELYPGHQRELGDLDEMAERRILRALVTNSKSGFFFDRGRPRGITHEVLVEFEKFLNRELNTGRLKIHVVFVPVQREQLIPSLTAGLGDIAAANLTITPERSRLVDFSVPLLDSASEIVVTGPSAPALPSLEDLAGKQVHVRASSSYYEHLRDLSSQFRQAGRPPIQIVVADDRLEDEDLLEMVNAGLIGITIVDNHKAQLWKDVFDDIEVHTDLTVNTGGKIAWAFRKESPKLKGAINKFLPDHSIGTSFGNTVFRRYLRNTKWVKNSLSDTDIEKFNSTVKLFQKYGAQYEFDWLMLAAQAYQESGLDNNVKSRVGAIGIMQVMPNTATSAPISIQNVERLENNIHAGVKILRHYRDSYFNDESIDEENQTLLAFAGYNAGPNRINRLRKAAAAQGLDPNVWFGNVERVVARKVGREPVQYVSNVYKYYLAYRLSVDLAASRPPISE